MEFFDSTGGPTSFDFPTGAETLPISFRLEPGTSFSAETSGNGELKVGYARVRTGPNVGGIAIFTRTDSSSKTVLYRAGAPTVGTLTEFTVFVDTLGNCDTGLALVNPADGPHTPSAGDDANLTLRLYDQQFHLIDTKELLLQEGGHLARFVSEFFEGIEGATDMEGVLTVVSDQPIAALTLLQQDDPMKAFPDDVPTLTTLPVLEGRTESTP